MKYLIPGMLKTVSLKLAVILQHNTEIIRSFEKTSIRYRTQLKKIHSISYCNKYGYL